VVAEASQRLLHLKGRMAHSAAGCSANVTYPAAGPILPLRGPGGSTTSPAFSAAAPDAAAARARLHSRCRYSAPVLPPEGGSTRPQPDRDRFRPTPGGRMLRPASPQVGNVIPSANHEPLHLVENGRVSDVGKSRRKHLSSATILIGGRRFLHVRICTGEVSSQEEAALDVEGVHACRAPVVRGYLRASKL